jgi:crotonobetainyl-CoA:carnitine CoA-transferase CaiB-like acyl-CoA transferase
MALSIDISLARNEDLRGSMPPSGSINPAAGAFRTADNRFISLSFLQPSRYWADLCRHIGREDLITDPRCATAETLGQYSLELYQEVASAFASKPLAHWVKTFRTLEGQWGAMQSPLEVGNDPQLRANGYIASIIDADGVERELVGSPAQFDETPAMLRRAPQFAEHTDDILREMGRSEDAIVELKIAGAVT